MHVFCELVAAAIAKAFGTGRASVYRATVIAGPFQSQCFIPRPKNPHACFVPTKKVAESMPFLCSTAACRALSWQFVGLIYPPPCIRMMRAHTTDGVRT